MAIGYLDYTITNYVLPQMKRLAILPTANALLTDADLIAIVNQAYRTRLLPELIDVQEDLYTVRYDVALAANTSSYTIPQAATGMILRNVTLVDSSGAETPLTRLSQDQVYNTLVTPAGFLGPIAQLFGFWLEDNTIYLFPNVGGAPTLTLRLRYFRRPNQLVANSATTQVSSVASNVLTMSASIGSTFANGDLVDIISNVSPFSVLAEQQTVTNVSGSNLTLSVAPPSTVGNGAYVAKWLATPVANLMEEAQPLLVQSGVALALESIGDRAGADRAEGIFQAQLTELKSIITPRVPGAPKKLYNIFGAFVRNPWGYRRRF